MDPEEQEADVPEAAAGRMSLGEEYGLTPEQSRMFDMYL